MSEIELTYGGTGANPEAGLAPLMVPYAEQQIRALCLVAAAARYSQQDSEWKEDYIRGLAIRWRQWIHSGKGEWDG